jgi:hypothetical protein
MGRRKLYATVEEANERRREQTRVLHKKYKEQQETFASSISPIQSALIQYLSSKVVTNDPLLHEIFSRLQTANIIQLKDESRSFN